MKGGKIIYRGQHKDSCVPIQKLSCAQEVSDHLDMGVRPHTIHKTSVLKNIAINNIKQVWNLKQRKKVLEKGLDDLERLVQSQSFIRELVVLSELSVVLASDESIKFLKNNRCSIFMIDGTHCMLKSGKAQMISLLSFGIMVR